MLDRRRVCEALLALRKTRSDFVRDRDFQKAADIHIPTIKSIEAFAIMPSLETLEKWVKACGITVTEFFAKLEGVKPDLAIGERIPPEHKKIIGALIAILDLGPCEAVDWITGNIETFHRAYVETFPTGRKRSRR